MFAGDARSSSSAPNIVVNSQLGMTAVAGGDFPFVVAAAKDDAAVQADRVDRAAGRLHVQLLQTGRPMVERAQRGKPARQRGG